MQLFFFCLGCVGGAAVMWFFRADHAAIWKRKALALTSEMADLKLGLRTSERTIAIEKAMRKRAEASALDLQGELDNANEELIAAEEMFHNAREALNAVEAPEVSAPEES